jgi:hypothetical protein
MRRFCNRVLAALLASASVLATHAARADATEDEALIRQGLDLRRAHRDAEALELFRKAYAIHATPRARAQIALAEQSLGQWVAAEADLRTALESDDAWVLRNRASLEEARSFVATHLGWLTVSSSVQARLSVNGTPAGATPMKDPLRVVAGTALLRVEADGYVTVDRSVRVEPGEHAAEFVALAPESTRASAPPAHEDDAARGAAPPLRPPAADSPSRPVPWAALSAAAVGAAGVTVGTIYGIEVLTDKAARDQHCDAGRCDPVGLNYDASARGAATVSTISFGVAAAGFVVSVWLFAREASRPRAIVVAPIASPRFAGLGAGAVW